MSPVACGHQFRTSLVALKYAIRRCAGSQSFVIFYQPTITHRHRETSRLPCPVSKLAHSLNFFFSFPIANDQPSGGIIINCTRHVTVQAADLTRPPTR